MGVGGWNGTETGTPQPAAARPAIKDAQRILLVIFPLYVFAVRKIPRRPLHPSFTLWYKVTNFALQSARNFARGEGMLKRLIAMVFIFCSAAVAWMILGGTLVARTSESDSSQRAKLTAQWGSAQTQLAPQVSARIPVDTYDKDKKRVERGYESVGVPLSASLIDVKLHLEQRRDGLLWYNLYGVGFNGRYRIRNVTTSRQLSVHFPFPSIDGTYANFYCTIGGRRVSNATALDQGDVAFDLAPGAETTMDVGYSSRGLLFETISRTRAKVAGRSILSYPFGFRSSMAFSKASKNGSIGLSILFAM